LLLPSERNNIVGMMNKIAIDAIRPVTPPSLFGIGRRIAYANRKYHCGWMCTGVTRRFAGVKLSGSLKMSGSLELLVL
jgi:hypothetical protein